MVEGSGTNQTTYRERVYSQLEKIHVGRSGEHSCEVSLSLPAPRSLAWSFEATDNKLRWYVQIDCDIESWPDLSETFPLSVRPRFVVEGRPRAGGAG